MAWPWVRQTIAVAGVFSCCLMHSLAVFWRQLGRKLRLATCTETLPWREHASAQKLFADAAADFFRPVHPAMLAEAEKMARLFVWREAEVVQLTFTPTPAGADPMHPTYLILFPIVFY
jgi:hypothetical protein